MGSQVFAVASLGRSSLSRVALIGLAAGTTACTPFKEDRSGDSNPSAATSGSVGPNGVGSDAQPSCDVSKPFGTPTFVPGLAMNGPSPVEALRLSADSLTGYFSEFPLSSPGTGPTSGIFTATRPRVGAPFGIATVLGDSTITAADVGSPSVTPDGFTLVFDRGAFINDHDEAFHLRYGTRTSVNMPFDYVGPVPGIPDSAGHDHEAFLREDGAVLYFTSTGATVSGDGDIYRATRNGSGFGFDPPVPLTELNTPFSEEDPVVTPDDRTIYFGSNRQTDGGRGPLQIWMATRASTSDRFAPPTIVAELNSVHSRAPSFVSADGCTLYFYSIEPGNAPTNGQYVVEKPAQ
jgi:hypothetical protein